MPYADTPEALGQKAAAGIAAPKKLTSFTGVDGGPLAWSPDSAMIAYRQGVSQRYSIYDMQRLAVAPVAGGAPEVLAATAEMGTGAPPIRSCVAAADRFFCTDLCMRSGGRLVRATRAERGRVRLTGLRQFGSREPAPEALRLE